MVAYLVLGICLLFGAALLARWFVSAPVAQVKKSLAWTLGILGVVGGLYLLFAGRHVLALLAFPLLFPLLYSLPTLFRRWKAAQGPTPGQSSTVETRFLRMSLDHDTGEMDGVVLEGEERGHKLSELDLERLIALWRELRAEDPQSTSVLEAFLDRTQEGWREDAGAPGKDEQARDGQGGDGQGGDGQARDGQGAHDWDAGQGAAAVGGAMTAARAREVLGVGPQASREEILDAYRRLMQKLHPDHGGSNFLAAQINQAKRVLIGE